MNKAPRIWNVCNDDPDDSDRDNNDGDANGAGPSLSQTQEANIPNHMTAILKQSIQTPNPQFQQPHPQTQPPKLLFFGMVPILFQEASVEAQESVPESSMMAHISDYMAIVSEALPWDDKVFAMAKQYQQWSLAAMDKFPAHFFGKVDGLGSIGFKDEVVAHFFCYLRFKGKGSDSTNTRAVATLKNIWWQTKAGIRLSAKDPNQLPFFCSKQISQANTRVQRLLKDWAVEDLKKAVPKTYLLHEHIELYCMCVIWEHMNDASSQFNARMLFALALRLQCGSGARHKHLVEVTWDKVQCHDYIVDLGESIYSLWIVPTKTISKLSAPVQFFLADDISHYLFHYWFQAFARKENKFVLPALGKAQQLDFAKAFTHENHKEACFDCAVTLGLPVADEVKHGYTSNCVRRGIGAQLGNTIKQVLQRHNLNYGRMPNSRIDIDVYCPEDVMQVTSSLHYCGSCGHPPPSNQLII